MYGYIDLLKDILIQLLILSFYDVIKLLSSYWKSKVQVIAFMCPVDFGMLRFHFHPWVDVNFTFLHCPWEGSLYAAQMAQSPHWSQVSFTMCGMGVNSRCLLCLFRIRQENDMVDSAPQWEAVLRRQKEKTQVDPNNRRSRHRSRSYVGSFSSLVPN